MVYNLKEKINMIAKEKREINEKLAFIGFISQLCIMKPHLLDLFIIRRKD